MPQPLLTSQRLLLVIAGLLLINSQLTLGLTQAPARWLAVALDTVLAPARAPLHNLALNLRHDPVTPPGIDPDLDLAEAYLLAQNEINKLKLERDELQRKLDVVTVIITRNASQKATPILARVNHVSRTINGPILHLDAGASVGIQPGMTVVWETTAIGRIIPPIGPSTAQVQLMTAQDATLQAALQPALNATTSASGLVQRIRIQPGDDSLSFVADVEVNLSVSVGDLVVLADELQYTDAQGWPVGRVTAVTEYTPDPLMRKRLIIRPDIDPRQLPDVAVLVPEGL